VSIGPEAEVTPPPDIELLSLRVRVVEVHAERDEARRERDDARRDYVELMVSECGGSDDRLLFAASKWGRAVALDLYDDARLVACWLAERGYDVEPPDESDVEDAQKHVARARRLLDAKHPPQTPDPTEKNQRCDAKLIPEASDA
jgi:hypothetical protein